MWQFFNRKGYPLLILIVVLTILVAAAPVTSQSNSSVSTALHQRRFGGEELFRGFYFGQGPVATLFPEVYANVVQETGRAAAIQDGWIEKIAQANPEFFPRFHQQLYSGHRVLVADAFEDGSWRLAEVIGAELGISAVDVRRGDFGNVPGVRCGGGGGTFAIEDIVLLHDVAVVEIGVVTVALVAAVVVILLAATPGIRLGQDNRLARDRFVNTVIKQLRDCGPNEDGSVQCTGPK